MVMRKACVTAFLVLRGVGAVSVLKSLPKYDKLRLNADNVTRINNVDVVKDENGDEIGICHFVDMNVYSLVRDGYRIAFPSTFPLVGLAAISLAIEHLNTGNGKVVQEIEGLDKRCNIRFTSEHMDTQYFERPAVDELINIVLREPEKEQLPCAFVGAFRSQTSVPTAILTGLKGYPQFSGVSQSTQLDDKTTFPLFGRVITSTDALAVALLDYWYNRLNIRHVAILHTDNSFGISYAQGIRLEANNNYEDLTIETVGFPRFASEEDYIVSIASMKQSGFRFFYTILGADQLEPILLEAHKQGIAGTGLHNWMLSNQDAARAITDVPFKKDSPLGLSAVGLTFYTAVGSLPSVGRFEPFLEALLELANSDDMEYLQSKVPQYPEDPGYTQNFTAATFENPSSFINFLYDATIAQGLAACKAKQDNGYFTGQEHYRATLNTSFLGTTGRILFDPLNGNRDPKSGLFTIRNLEKQNVEGSGNFTLVNVRTDQFNENWVSIKPVMFNDATLNVPLDLPKQEIDYNYIGKGLRAGGLTMSAIIMLLSAACALWTQCYRSSRVVRSSQPVFLDMICCGTFLMGASIIPLSFDDEVASSRGCDIACMSFPWLLSLGWVFSFSALFTKTSRVNKVFKNPDFRRVQIAIVDVMKPMATLLGANILILSLWTGLSPIQWEREEVANDEFGRTSKSQGACTSEHSLFLIILSIVDIGVLIFAVYQAYVARNIATEFSESEYVARVMSLILVVAFIGIPVVYIAEDTPQAYFFVLAGIIFVICISLLLLIFVPKELYRRIKNKPSQAEVIRHSMGTSSSPSSSISKFDTPSSSNLVGTMVVDHPKFRKDLEMKNAMLQRSNEQLHKLLKNITESGNITKQQVEQYRAITGEASSEKQSSQSTSSMIVREGEGEGEGEVKDDADELDLIEPVA